MQRVPYEGVSRMQTSLRRKHRDRVVRRGLALIIESDFYATDAGRAHFADQLTSIRYCVQETCSTRHALNLTAPHTLCSRSPLCLQRLRRALRLPHVVSACPCQRDPVENTQPRRLTPLRLHARSGNYDFSYDRAKNLRPRRSMRPLR